MTSPVMQKFFFIMMVLFCSTPSGAAEIQLRDVCHVSGTLVRLGDIADVYDENAETAKALANTEVCRAPFAGQRRTLTHRQVRDQLSRGGWNLVEHQLSGASQVVVHANERIRLATAALSRSRRVSPIATRSAHQQVENLLLDDLHQQYGKQQQKVEFQLSENQSRLIRESHENLRLARPLPGGSGKHRVELATPTKSNPRGNMILAVHVEAPQAVVTARRALPKGKLITRDDIELAYSKANPTKHSVTRLEDVLGQETTTRLAQGQTVESRHARPRILVRSGSLVTVFARNAGIQVRTTAAARENGARGEVIWVEDIKTRKKYSARVTEVDTVEVLAKSPTVRGN
jgi:flagella basal body P-ring formation protein FlgA